MSYFLSDIDLRFVRDNEYLPFTNAKPYLSTKDYKRLFDSCKKRYKSQLEREQTPKQSLDAQLKDIEKYAIQTPLSARYVQTCYKQTLEIHSSWLTKLEDVVRSFLGNSSIVDEHFLTTCYRINKLHLWHQSAVELKWYQASDGQLLVPSKSHKANVTLPVSSDILFFMRKLIKRARKCIRFPQLKRIKTLKLDEKVAVLEVSKTATHFDYFLKLSTLQKGKPIYIPLKRNPYLDECLQKGERLPFVQVRITDKTCTISAIVGYDKAPLRPSTESIGLDFGMVSMFTTSDGERHGLSSFTKLKIWDNNADVNAGRVINQRRSLILEFPVYAKRSASRTVRCQVQEASKACHRRYCHDNGLMTYEESRAKGSL